MPELTEGEHWTRDELAALLADRFSPAAVGRFVWRSSVRSARIRRERPELARRAWGWAAAGGLAWVAGALAGAGPFRRRLRSGLAWWAACAVMLDWHLGMVQTPDGRPRQLGAADALTLLRAWLVPVALDSPTPLVCALGAGTDVLDGRLARAGEPTRIGRDLEGLVDACFAAACLRGAVRRGWLGAPAGAAELTRLGAGFGFALLVYFGRAHPPDPLLLRSARVTTTARVGALLLAGTGRRRAADALLLSASAASAGLIARALARPRR